MNAVSRGGYEPATDPINLGRRVITTTVGFLTFVNITSCKIICNVTVQYLITILHKNTN